jgi:WD40 repeat protein
MCIDPMDKLAYFGTKTGDIIEVDLKNAIYKRIGPLKKLFSQGVNLLKMLPNSDLIVGTGEGLLAKVSFSDFKVKGETKLMGAISSVALTADSAYFFCGTDQANIYWCESSSLKSEVRNTCHYDRINDLAFPFDYSDVFGTCSKNDIRIWNTKTRQELLRIHVPNLECFCIGFMRDGKSIYSGWHDGKIRAFLPQSGKLLYCINDGHTNGVTAITSTSDNMKLLTGGMNGEIRIWKINKQSQSMEASLKEHRSRVWCIQVNSLDDRAISVSADGSCIVWDIKTYTRLACMFETTMFKQLVYHPDESQILTTGTNRKITYWDAIEAVEIRMMDGSLEGEVNSLSITRSGEYFASGGEDKELKIWDYDQGVCKWVGYGHSNTINKVSRQK